MSKPIKVYIISGMGAGSNVFDRVQFPENTEPVFIPWLIPDRHEDFTHYSLRMAEKIDASEPFYLIGYSFGGMVVQEINERKHAEKIVLLGSLRDPHEMSRFFRFLRLTKVYKLVPMSWFTKESFLSYAFFRRLYDPRLPGLFDYFTVRDPRYLSWSIDRVLQWKHQPQNNVVQVLASKDVIFPPHNSPKADYIVQGASHLFVVTKPAEVSRILAKELT